MANGLRTEFYINETDGYGEKKKTARRSANEIQYPDSDGCCTAKIKKKVIIISVYIFFPERPSTFSQLLFFNRERERENIYKKQRLLLHP